MEAFIDFLKQTGFYLIKDNPLCLVMFAIAAVLLYLGIKRQFEPLLLVPIAIGMILTNLPGANMFHSAIFGEHVDWSAFAAGNAGLLDYLYIGVKLGIYPCLIFMGVGAMTDFSPMIANPRSMLLGAAAQLGIFTTYAAANGLYKLTAYCYMALVPFIQPPIMKLLTTKKERAIVMTQLKPVSKTMRILFPIIMIIAVSLLVPSAAPLVGCLMFGNLLRECGVTERLSKTVQNELMNIVTILLGISVGATATAANFLNWKTLLILGIGIIAFSFGTAGGVLLAKFMNLFTKNKINPLIGSAGVSAVPMAARVSQKVGQKENPGNFLLMHAMGPNVSGVIGSAIAAGVLISLLGR